MNVTADERLTSNEIEGKNIQQIPTVSTLSTTLPTMENTYVNIPDVFQKNQQVERKNENIPTNIYEERVKWWALMLQRESLLILVLTYLLTANIVFRSFDMSLAHL